MPSPCSFLQVMECLRERTVPLDMLCIKTIDGTPAVIDWSAVPGVSFSQLQAPSCAVTTQSDMHAPKMASLARAPLLQSDSMMDAQGVKLPLSLCAWYLWQKSLAPPDWASPCLQSRRLAALMRMRPNSCKQCMSGWAQWHAA